MKSVLKVMVDVIESVKQATRATALARSGKWKEAQAMYTK